MLTINTNINNLKLQRNLNTVNFSMQTALNRLSTGYKINYASDDAAGLVISKALETQTRGLGVANQNAQMANNILSVADGALSQVSDLTMRIRDLALQAANGGYSITERTALQKEVSELSKSMEQIVSGAKFNDYKIFGEQSAVSVTSAKELYEALNNPNILNNVGMKIILTDDIDLNELGDVDGRGSNWKALGTSSDMFKGTIEGNGHVIKNLKINATTGAQALFAYADGATISNLTVENANITSSGSAGILIAEAYNATIISNCSTSGSVKGVGCSGGLIGRMYMEGGIIADSSSSANIDGGTSSYTGGLVGDTNGLVDFYNSYSTGNVKGTSSVGGIVGYYSYSGTISNCYSAGSVTGTNNVGGIAGSFGANIVNSYASGNIYSAGGATSTSSFGGLVSGGSGKVTNSFYTGQNCATIGYRGAIAGNTGSGSLLLKDYAFVTQNTSGVNTTTGIGTGSAQSGSVLQTGGKNISWFQNASNIGFINTGSADPKFNNQWDLSTLSSGSPILRKGNYDFVNESIQTIKVGTAKELYEALNDPNALNNTRIKIVLTNDIDLNELGDIDGRGSNWRAVGDSSNYFRGTFDGNGYTISNLTINNNADFQGLFGFTYDVTIQNVNLKNANIQSSGSYVGALAAYCGTSNGGVSVVNCSVLSGNASGKNYVGGLVGSMDSGIIKNCSSGAEVVGTSYYAGGLIGYTDNATISNCYATGNIKGVDYVGGLAGTDNYGSVNNSYATGNVTGKNYVGGLLGCTETSISNCYSTGDVSGVDNVGAFLGYAAYNTIANCFSKGNVSSLGGATAGSSFGGFVGHQYGGTIDNSYSTGLNLATIGNRGSFIGYVEEDLYSSNVFCVEQAGLPEIGIDNSYSNPVITPKSEDWFNMQNIKTIFNNSSKWDYSGSTPKLIGVGTKKVDNGSVVFQIGTDGTDNSSIKVNLGFDLGGANYDITTVEAARSTIEKCDALLKELNKKRGEIGASVNIMGSVVNGNTITNENLTASKSRIQDADIARESANMVRSQILQNATAALLAQSQNISGNLALQLLAGIKR